MTRAARFALRLLVIGLVAYLGLRGLDWLDMRMADASAATRTGALAAVLLVYALVIAVPFVPGVEIAVTLMMVRGPGAAPALYAATVIGLMIAYLVGRHLPVSWLARIASDLGFHRAATAWRRVGALPPRARVELLRRRLPARISWIASDLRYVMIAALVNLPGSSVIGGGGGIMMAAGMSGLFLTRYMVLTVALAVAPVPLLVWTFGTGLPGQPDAATGPQVTRLDFRP